MLSNISNLGTVLSKEAQKAINGGKLNCFQNGACTEISNRCGECQCRPAGCCMPPCP